MIVGGYDDDFFKILLPDKSKKILCLFLSRICIMGGY